MPQLESSEDTGRRPVELPVQTLSCGQWEARGHGQRSNSASSVLSTRATILQGPWNLNRQSGACWKEHDIRSKRMCVLAHHWPHLTYSVPHVWNAHVRYITRYLIATSLRGWKDGSVWKCFTDKTKLSTLLNLSLYNVSFMFIILALVAILKLRDMT